MRVVAWWIDILYMLRKPLQLPMQLIHMLTGIPFRDMFEYYAFGELKGTAMLSDLQRFLFRKAEGISLGEPELNAVRNVKDPFWLATTDFVMTGLAPLEVRNAFYADHKIALTQLLKERGKQLPPGLLDEALTLSAALIDAYASKRPFILNQRYNIWEVTSNFMRGFPWQLRTGNFRHIHDWTGPPDYLVRVEESRFAVQQGSSFK